MSITILRKYFPRKQLTIYLKSLRHAHNKVIFSGIQPTGVPHLGNYFGAIKRWTALQNEENKCIFSIVDLHSLTVPQEPEKLRHNIHLMAACLLACGIDPEKSTFFLQSHVPQHAELSWILGCLTTMARLTRLPQYKEKSENLDAFYLGLYVYPVLQSADILLYKATDVPVGEDQIQHIQLSQHLVKSFNNRYGKIFPTPNPLIDDTAARIKSLRQPDKKMSKSDSNIRNRIELTDTPDVISKHIREALTDFTSQVTYDPENRPGVSNLILIHSLSTGKTFDEICEDNRHLDTGQYKKVVAEAVIEHLRPVQERVKRLMAEPTHIAQVLKRGAESAREVAARTMKQVKGAIGLSCF